MDEDKAIGDEMSGLALDGMDVKEIWEVMRSPQFQSGIQCSEQMFGVLFGVMLKLELRIKVLESETGIDTRAILDAPPQE